MQTQRKWQVLSIILIIVVAAMSFAAVAAQDDAASPDDAAPFVPPCGMTGDFVGRGMMGGGMMGRGMMGGSMMGGGMMGYDNSMHDLTAELLGLDAQALWDARQAGKSIAEIAEEQGVELQVIIEAHMVAAGEHMAEMVAAGTMTQEQASEMLVYMATNIEAHLSGDFSGGFGPGMMWDDDSDTVQGRGMMGRGGGHHGMGMGHGGW